MAGAPIYHPFHTLDVTAQEIREQIVSVRHSLGHMAGALSDPILGERLTLIAGMCEATALAAGGGLEAISSRLDQQGETLAGIVDGVMLSAVEHARIANAAEAVVAILKRRGGAGPEPAPGHITGLHIKSINATGKCNRQSVEGRCVTGAGFGSVFDFETVEPEEFVGRLRESIEATKAETHAGLFHDASDQDLHRYYLAGIEAATAMRANKSEAALSEDSE